MQEKRNFSAEALNLDINPPYFCFGGEKLCSSASTDGSVGSKVTGHAIFNAKIVPKYIVKYGKGGLAFCTFGIGTRLIG